jgi:hypothetical protein
VKRKVQSIRNAVRLWRTVGQFSNGLLGTIPSRVNETAKMLSLKMGVIDLGNNCQAISMKHASGDGGSTRHRHLKVSSLG